LLFKHFCKRKSAILFTIYKDTVQKILVFLLEGKWLLVHVTLLTAGVKVADFK